MLNMSKNDCDFRYWWLEFGRYLPEVIDNKQVSEEVFKEFALKVCNEFGGQMYADGFKEGVYT